MRRTKIVCTIGPASSSPEMLKQLIEAGMDVARLNFSHGTYEYHGQCVRNIRQVARELGKPLAILLDLQGPKIRTGLLKDGKSVFLNPGNKLVITTEDIQGDVNRVSTTYIPLPQDVKAGDRILISDGLIELSVISSEGFDVVTEVIYGGELKEHQGINLPGVHVSSPSMTGKDVADLEFGLSQGVDYVALSFVRTANDIKEIKNRIAATGQMIPVVSKIEKPEALQELDEILRLTDVVMIARGDLGVEIPLAEVPPIQKMIIEEANDACIPVITATQMLDSMIRNPRPTRAETSDVANAIIDGTDAVMLSGETAIGQFPVESVKMMARIAEVAELSGRHSQHHKYTQIARQTDIPDAISAAARAIVEALPIQAIVAFTQTGSTAQLMSHHRPSVPILAMTPWETVYNKLNLLWGVTPIWTEKYSDNVQEMAHIAHQALLQLNLAKVGDTIILVGGFPLAARGPTNFLQIVKIGYGSLIMHDV